MMHLGDITKLDGGKIPPVDTITFGSPCTRLSVAGQHDGFNIAFSCKGSGKTVHWKHTEKATDNYKYQYSATCPVCGKTCTASNESALFFHAVRILHEMREATNGAYPTFAVWEQVPGAFSSNGGADFQIALQELAKAAGEQATIPKPAKKWLNAGCILGNGYSIAWRVLDAQYWGVPQRRRRIALVVDFAERRAPKILFEQNSVPGNTAQGTAQGQKAANSAGASPARAITRAIYSTGGVNPSCNQGGTAICEPDIARTLTARYDSSYNPGSESGQNVVAVVEPEIAGTLTSRCDSSAPHGAQYGNLVAFSPAQAELVETSAFLSGQSAQAKGIGYAEEVTPTLKAEAGGNTVPAICTNAEAVIFDARGNGNGKIACTITGDHNNRVTDYTALVVPKKGTATLNAITQTKVIPFDTTQITSKQNQSQPKEGAPCHPLCARGHTPSVIIFHKPVCMTSSQSNCQVAEDSCGTLTAMHEQPIVVFPAETVAAVDCRNDTENTELYPTLQAKQNGGISLNYTPPIRIGRRVRRLTPLECERLQDFPDGWTDIGFYTDAKGKQKPVCDSVRYKALGNTIARPPWRFVLFRISEFLPTGATLGSLFDGIGGFPTIWEEWHGQGTALWASEIEPFPISVTLHHLPQQTIKEKAVA